jgi:hypothetical protein
MFSMQSKNNKRSQQTTRYLSTALADKGKANESKE